MSSSVTEFYIIIIMFVTMSQQVEFIMEDLDSTDTSQEASVILIRKTRGEGVFSSWNLELFKQ